MAGRKGGGTSGSQGLEARMQGLKARGFTAEFVRRDGRVLCRSCSSVVAPDELSVVAEHRFPGLGPGGEAAVLRAVICPRCRASGQVLLGGLTN